MLGVPLLFESRLYCDIVYIVFHLSGSSMVLLPYDPCQILSAFKAKLVAPPPPRLRLTLTAPVMS